MKPIKNANDLSFLDERKTKKRIARNRRPFEVTQKVHTSSVELRMKLKSFVEEILEKAFNRLMKHTWDLAFGARRAVGQRNSDMHYFQFMKFCMEYCRLAELNSSLIDNCIGTEEFHQVQVKIIDNFDLALSNKSEAKFYGMRAQYALSAYKELLLTHQHLLEKGNSEDRRIASAAVSHIQNVEEYRELALDILRKFAPGAFSKNFLRELLLANHYYLRILERSVKTGRLQRVKRREKIKKKAKRKPRAAKSEKSGGDAISAKVDKMAQDKLDSLWDEAVNESLIRVVNGTVEYSKDQIVLNALLEVEDEEHQRFAMLRIQRALREKRPDDAVGLYRAARQIWNTDGVFGTDDMTVEAEINELREIFNADLMEVAKSFKKVNEAMEQHYKDTVEAEEKENQENQEENPEEDYYDEEEEEEPRYETKEIDFDLSDHISKYSKSDILKWYVFILDEFDRNTPELNKAVVKMLHRIAFDLRMPIKLFQLSLFRTFNRIGEHFANVKPEDRKKRSFFEVYEFGYHLLKKFFQMMDEIGSTKMGPEVLFWKETRDCIEIEYGDDEKGADKNEENPDEPKKPKEKRKTKEKRQKSPKKPRAKRRKVDPWEEDGNENENEKDEVEADFLDLADQPSQDLLEDGLHINTTLDESSQDTSRLRLETPSPDSSQDPDRFRLPSLSPSSSQNSTRLRIASSSPDSLRQTNPMPENNPENQQEEDYSDKENAAIDSDDDDGGAVKKMEISLERTPCCFALGSSNILAVGNMDGCLELNTYDPDPERQDFTEHWRFRTKSSIRAVTFNEDGSAIYGIGRNKSLCSYDTETGKRTRCIVKSHEARPTTICLLPSTARKNQQFATGDENGYVRKF
ncbi:hypothetical protein WR25_20300 isoform D [Diploscapter pachys]|uniref:Uncharacterized protein n=1 Tax=Diploscapter pachys TaxID=2018661 RepID=A0A2A2LP91_9BILA|nr:hypothetical protein WR25_20300 isoform A [Diploscapter pachys]PAV88050.1 hypothetical protein WR25_20300 isoform C [Diploscapter pachys]PAV88051.1 hypothetical protein WR25_20300 isoform D [Diploscapter pachys]